MGYSPVHPDALAESLGRPAADIFAELLELELEGRVAAAAGGLLPAGRLNAQEAV